MAVTLLEIDRACIDILYAMPSDALKVYITLLNRAQTAIKVGMTIAELARTCGTGTQAAIESLRWLVKPFIAKSLDTSDQESTNPFIFIEEKGTDRYAITISPFYANGTYHPVPFTFKNTDETRLKTIEAELLRTARIASGQHVGEASGIAQVAKNSEERALISEIEQDLGGALTTIDAYYLGKAISAFGLTRVGTVWRTRAMSAAKPIQTLTAILWNGAVGKANKPRAQKETDGYEILS